MIDLPDPPQGSAIAASAVEDGVRLEWRGRPRGTRIMLMIVLILAVLGAIGGSVLSALLYQYTAENGTVAYLIWTAAMLVPSVLGVFLCVRLRSLFREGLVLARDSISYIPPLSTSEVSRLFGWGGSRPLLPIALGVAVGLVRTARELAVLWRKRETIHLRKSVISELRLEGRGRFEHLTIRVGREEIDIAKRVSHADREWLLDVLRRWRGGG